MKSVVIVGAGGCGRTTLEILKEQNGITETWNILGFIDENELLHGKIINKYPVLGGLGWLKQNSNTSCIIAVDDCEVRRHLVKELQNTGVAFPNIIHPSAIIEDWVEMGKGITIQPMALVRVNSKIGDHVHIDTKVIIGHEAIIGDYCTIAPRADIDGKVKLGEGVYVGSHAVILPGLSIGSWATIGARAVVTKDIPENAVAVGMPAKVIKRKTPL